MLKSHFESELRDAYKNGAWCYRQGERNPYSYEEKHLRRAWVKGWKSEKDRHEASLLHATLSVW